MGGCLCGRGFTWSCVGLGVVTEGVREGVAGWPALFKGSLIIGKKDLYSFLSFY